MFTDIQHPALVEFFVSTGATIQLAEKKTTVQFAYRDPRDLRIYLLNGYEDLDNLLISELTTEFTRSGNKYTLFFEQGDWLYLEKDKVALLSSLAAMPNVIIELQIVNDEPDDEFLIKYMNKGRQDSID
jgi:hypothetical protein